jgi:hypothetical protein
MVLGARASVAGCFKGVDKIQQDVGSKMPRVVCVWEADAGSVLEEAERKAFKAGAFTGNVTE